MQANFRPVQRLRSSDEVAAQIQDAILAGQLMVGDKLPNERELCRSFGVGRSTLREALRALEALGIILTRPGANGGVFVREPGVIAVGSALQALLQFRHATVHELAEYRLSFEDENAFWAVQRAEETDVQRLFDLSSQISEAATRRRPWPEIAALDVEVHTALAQATYNQVRVAIFLAIAGTVGRAVSSIESLITPELAASVAQDHHELATAVDLRDSDRARRVVRRHLEEFTALEIEVSRSIASAIGQKHPETALGHSRPTTRQTRFEDSDPTARADFPDTHL